jgi:hypothetical protein
MKKKMQRNYKITSKVKGARSKNNEFDEAINRIGEVIKKQKHLLQPPS